MSNVSSRFTFRDGRTYLTGYPKWPGVHNLNDPVYSGYDTLYIGPPTPDQQQYFIIGPSCPTVFTPKISIYVGEGIFGKPTILSPGLREVHYSDDGVIVTIPTDTPDIVATLKKAHSNAYPREDARAAKILTALKGQNIPFAFQNNYYLPEYEFRPDFDITSENPWTPLLILPVGPYPDGVGYSITGEKPDEGAFVYVDYVQKTEGFTVKFTVPVLFEYGPRRHFQVNLNAGENWNDTCYHFRTVNLTGPTGPTDPN